MYEKESPVEGETMGGGENAFRDEPFQGYPHLLDEETGKFPRSAALGLCVYHAGTMWSSGIGSKFQKQVPKNGRNQCSAQLAQHPCFSNLSFLLALM